MIPEEEVKFRLKRNMPLKTCIPPLLKILFVCGFGGIFTLMQKSQVQWDYLVFTQIWPQTACIEINETHGEGKCAMPSGVKSWTIHGLWPSVDGGTGPYYCNDSWPFRPDEIKDLQPILETRWPNLMADTARTSFWKHEWTKHGTCAASLPALDSEHNYFAVSLQLQQKFNLSKILADAGIHPSYDTSFKLDQVRKAIKAFTKHQSRILCMEAKTKTRQILAQIEICTDKDFRPIDCVKAQRYSLPLEGNPRFVRLKRKSNYPAWDPYPYFPQFMDCKDNLPIKYFPIVGSEKQRD